MTWYQTLISCIKVQAFGLVGRILEAAIAKGLFSVLLSTTALDVDVSEDIEQWHLKHFKPWVENLLVKIGSANSKAELLLSDYVHNINGIITALHVARSFYSKQASEAFQGSIKETELMKAAFCREVAQAVAAAYKGALKEYGLTPEETVSFTDSPMFEGSLPEKFTWPGTVVANYKIFKNEEHQQQPTADQPQPTAKVFKDKLPWLFTAAFGLIAWSAAARK